jgi:hypothetical protein
LRDVRAVEDAEEGEVVVLEVQAEALGGVLVWVVRRLVQ